MSLQEDKVLQIIALKSACNRSPAHLLNCLVQMGIEGPTRMAHKGDEESFFDPNFNQATWNTLFVTDCLDKARAALKEDMGRTHRKICDPGYAQVLLDNFLCSNPNPTWLSPRDSSTLQWHAGLDRKPVKERDMPLFDLRDYIHGHFDVMPHAVQKILELHPSQARELFFKHHSIELGEDDLQEYGHGSWTALAVCHSGVLVIHKSRGQWSLYSFPLELVAKLAISPLHNIRNWVDAQVVKKKLHLALMDVSR